MIIVLSAWGIISYRELPRESNPEVKIPIAVVSVAYPGAGPSDVEEFVTKKIEAELLSLKSIDTLASTSANSLSITTINFDSNENLDDAIRRVRDTLANIEAELPEDATAPIISEISFDDQPILTIALTGSHDEFTLRENAETLGKELEKIPGVREVQLSGGDIKEFSIEYDLEKLSLYNISLARANQAIQSINSSFPSGNFQGTQFSYPIRSDARFFTIQELGSIPVAHTEEGAIIRLQDIASIESRPVERAIYSRISLDGSDPAPSVTIDIVKKSGSSILGVAEAAKTTIDRLTPSFGDGMRAEITVDFSEDIKRDFKQLSHDFLLTVSLVMITLFLIVGLKEAIIAGIAIPLVFFATFSVMLATGTSLNFLSLFSLLLALGLLVDDAIVVVSATKQYLRSGKFTPEEAVLLVLRDFKVVLLTTTLATTFAFLPLLLSSGIIGQFIKSIPITVSVTLISSLLIAIMINHPLAATFERIRFTTNMFRLSVFASLSLMGVSVFLPQGIARFAGIAMGLAFLVVLLRFRFFKNGKKLLEANDELVKAERESDDLIKTKLRMQGTDDHSLGDRLLHGYIRFDPVILLYERMLRSVLRTRRRAWTTVLGTLGLFLVSASFPVLGIVRTEFFPASDERLLFVNISATPGFKLDETDAIARKAEHVLLKYPDIRNFSTIVGKPGLSQNAADNTPRNSTDVASITVRLSDPEERDIPSYDLATQIRNDMGSIQDATISVESLQGGPPSGAAFEARISGDDADTLDRIARDLRDILSSIPNVTDIDTSIKEAPAEYVFILDPVRLELFDLDAIAVGSTLRAAVSGIEVTTVIENDDEVKVIARIHSRSVDTLEDLRSLEVMNKKGVPISLREVSTIELRPSVSAIKRLDGKRVITLTSGVEGNANPQDILSSFQEKVAKEYDLPDGYTLAYGGQNEENEKSVQSILRAMLIAAALIISTLVIQFNSFRKAIMVLVTLPLALIGVFIGLAVFGVPLSFPGLIGILALFGIVVKNAIILVDKIRLNHAVGIPFEEGIIDAGKSRFEAIVITSICTILGILPITLSNDLWRALGSAVIFGLAFSSFLTLFIIPALSLLLASDEDRKKIAED